MSGNVTELSGNCLVPKRERRLRDFRDGKVAFFTNESRKISFYRKSPKLVGQKISPVENQFTYLNPLNISSQ